MRSIGNARDKMMSPFEDRKNRGQRGQSLLEVAFVVPVLLLLMVGLIEIGRFAYYSVLVSNAAHAGAQYGAQSLITSGDVNGIRQAAKNDGQIAGITMTVTSDPAVRVQFARPWADALQAEAARIRWCMCR